MKLPISLLFISLLLVACNKQKVATESELKDLYAQLDSEIENSRKYEIAKENRIAGLRNSYDLSHDQNQRTEIINQIINEYGSYNADSALYYIGLNLRRPAVKAIPGEHTRLTIKRANVLAHAGLFSDALAIMREIPRDSLDSTMLETYYSTYCAIFQYLSEYTNNHETAAGHEALRTLYVDSLRQVINNDSFNHMVFVLSERARKGDTDHAISVLSDNLGKYQSGSRQYSVLASLLAYIYKMEGMENEYKRYLVLSAISDVRGAVKENMSFRELATVMFEEGDVERANRYLKKSIVDANFYSALMRNAQSSKILPVIDEAYSSLQLNLNSRLRGLVWISSALLVILAVTVLLILIQFRSLRKANTKIKSKNEELSSLSEQLKDTNRELQGKNVELSVLSQELTTMNTELAEKNNSLSLISARLQVANEELESRNRELHDFNKTKEQYAGLFMEYSSSAISTLQHYQQSLRNLALKGINRTGFLKKLESTEIADQLLKNFYGKFDEAILNIYPAFVDKFNALLKPDEQIALKSGELLNTELRLFALIRIGIDDSAKIAEFLRCSISTVYTYRSKMRKRAVNPDSFENDVRNMV